MTFESRNINIFNNAIDTLIKSRDVSLRMQKSNLESFNIRGSAGRLFVTDHDQTRQLRYIFFGRRQTRQRMRAPLRHLKETSSRLICPGCRKLALTDAYDVVHCLKETGNVLSTELYHSKCTLTVKFYTTLPLSVL